MPSQPGPVRPAAKEQRAGTHWQGFDGPHHCVIFRHPLGTAHAGLELGSVGIAGHRDDDLHVVGNRLLLELALGLLDKEHC